MKTAKANNKDKKQNRTGFIRNNHEIAGILFLALGVLVLFSFYFNNSIGMFGRIVQSLFLGMFGGPAFVLPPVMIFYSFLVIFKKELSKANKRAIYAILLLLLVSAFIQTAEYDEVQYRNLGLFRGIGKLYADGRSLQGGGVLGGLISMPFLSLFKALGTIVILTALTLIDIILLTNISIANFIKNLRAFFVKGYKAGKKVSAARKTSDEGIDMDDDGPVIVGENEDLKLEFRPRPKVIDFRIEKTSKELKEKIGNTSEAKAEEPAYNAGFEAESLIMKDIKSIKEASPKKKAAEHMSSSPVDGNSIPVENIETAEKAAGDYRYPPFHLLEEDQDGGKSLKAYKTAAAEGAKRLEDTLASFGVAAKVINVSRGPSVTRYELQPSTGVKVSKIVNLADDISLNLASAGVRIEAPIPGKAAIGIEVPNREVTPVVIREVLESPEFEKCPSKLSVALGKDISGQSVIADIAKMPHLLIAGATGSGKSVCVNNLIVSILYKASPDEVKLLMIDPKVVELGIYNGIPHLLIPVVTDPRKAAGALNWAVQEMISRYKLFADRGARDIGSYNKILTQSGEQGTLPQIVIIIDELADLMMAAPNDVEDAICRLAQMARAAGMHLVIATQRPSVDVITGVIKANIPSRISFAVSSQVDSRTILDMAGAEKLLGKGDMLFYPIGIPKPIRVQGAYVADREIEKIVEYVKNQATAEYDNNIIEEINNENEVEQSDPGDNDELLPRAIELVIDAGQASVSLIQRKFKVGYARAARIVDQMEARGIVGGFEGSKPRQVHISRQQWQEMQMADKIQA